EPGTPNYMFVRGISTPIFSHKDVYLNQPLVVLDGIPLISTHPFSYAIQAYDIDRIGPENNLLSNIEIDNIAPSEVHKAPDTIAVYRPIAATGVIKVATQTSAKDDPKSIGVHSFIRMPQRPHVTTTNGSFEHRFRQQSYEPYTT